MEDWIDRLAIMEVLVRYASGIDRRDWALFRRCWADEIDANYGPQIGRFRSGDEITAVMARAHASMGHTWHRLTNFDIHIDGDRALTRCYVHAVLNTDASDPDRWMDVTGHYDDELSRVTGEWRIIKRTGGGGRVIGTRPPGLESWGKSPV